MLGISAAGRPGRKFFDQLVRVSFAEPGAAEVWQAPAGSYLAGEPAFIPDPADPRAGSILVPLFDSAREATSFLLFDAFDLPAGPRAVLPLEGPLHLAFHSVFHPQ